jgi:hypothetical protein
MIDFSNKWDEIDRASRKGVTTRVMVEHKLDLFIGYSNSGGRLLKLKSGQSVFISTNLPDFENIDLVLNDERGSNELSLILVDSQLKDLFSAISHDLVNASASASTAAAAAQIFLNRLGRWADLLEERRRNGLSFSQQLGLLGELCFLVEMLGKNWVTPTTLITGWRGPDGDARDNSLGAISVEVKAALATSRKVLKISSLDQLDTEDRQLVVSRYQFSRADTGISLASSIKTIESILRPLSAEWSDLWRKLYLLGYDPEADYADAGYIEVDKNLYLIEGDFPRLTPTNVSPAIRKASYEIDCAMVNDFIITDHTMKGRINGS